MEDKFYKYLDIYRNLPMPLKRSLGKFYNLLPISIRYGEFYQEYYKRIYSGVDQVVFLEELINYAKKNIPFYAGNNHLEKHYDFPIINKKIIKQNFNSFVNNKLYKKMILTNTGGSSGQPFQFYLHKGLSRPKENAHFDWYWGQFGYKRNDRILMIRGLPLKNNALFEYQAIDNKLILTCYGLNNRNIVKVFNEVKKYKPKFIHGYPSSVKIFTSLLIENNLKFDNEIKALFLGSEFMPNYDRNFLSEFYKSYVVNWYGHSERLVHAGNCPYSNEYHIYPFYGYLELLDEKNNIIKESNKIGRIVATGFDNYVMPFIRYDTEDFAEYSDNSKCKCGFKGKSLKRIVGREQDFIELNDFTKVSTTALIFGQHFDQFKKIREIQLQQDIHGELTVRIVKEASYNLNDEKQLKEHLLKSVNNRLNIHFEYTNEIEKTISGKHKFLIKKNL